MTKKQLVVLVGVIILASSVAFANDMAVNSTNPISGSYDLELTMTGDATPAYVETNSPVAEPGISIEFKLMVTDLDMGGASGMRNLRVVKGLSTFPAPGAVGMEHMVLFLKRPFDGSSNYRIRFMTGTDAGFFLSCGEGFFAIPNVSKTVRLEWVTGTGAFTNDARCSLYINDVLVGENTTSNFQDYNVDAVRFGIFQPTDPADGSGSYQVDDVVLTRLP